MKDKEEQNTEGEEGGREQVEGRGERVEEEREQRGMKLCAKE